jgi:hypothetical protein
MKINLPYDVITDCMMHSPKFRELVALSIMDSDVDRVTSVFMTQIKNGNKIAAIKDLREWTRGNQVNLALVKNSFPQEYQVYDGYDGCSVLSVASAKRIVELFENRS